MPRATDHPTFSDAEFARRHAALRALLGTSDVECVVVYGAGRNADVQWLSDWPGTRESYLVWPARGDPALLVQLNNHVPNARRMAIVDDVRWAGPKAAETLAGVLRERGATRRIALAGAIPWHVADTLRAALPGAALSDLSPSVRDLRVVRSDEELERFRIAARLTDKAMAALEREARPGIRESELEAVVECAYGREGRHGIHFMATTPMRAPAIGVPSQIQSDRVLAKGDVLITEISAEYRGYSGQIHRAYAIGEEPTEAYRRLHDVAVEAYERVSEVLRDGATTDDVLDAAEVIGRRGFTVYDDLLHGAGQLPPIVQTRATRRGPYRPLVFREDMVVVVQPNVVTDDARMGLQVGETLRITKDGIERLHAYPMRFVVCGT